ncbi:MAG: flagellar hook-length control protein FliK [Tissierellales bacterium]|jgi:flagellar hook-length control protein FliK|nr:flagellar hook-length control protein FliK [Tissierellales bacterium]
MELINLTRQQGVGLLEKSFKGNSKHSDSQVNFDNYLRKTMNKNAGNEEKASKFQHDKAGLHKDVYDKMNAINSGAVKKINSMKDETSEIVNYNDKTSETKEESEIEKLGDEASEIVDELNETIDELVVLIENIDIDANELNQGNTNQMVGDVLATEEVLKNSGELSSEETISSQSDKAIFDNVSRNIQKLEDLIGKLQELVDKIVKTNDNSSEKISESVLKLSNELEEVVNMKSALEGFVKEVIDVDKNNMKNEIKDMLIELKASVEGKDNIKTGVKTIAKQIEFLSQKNNQLAESKGNSALQNNGDIDSHSLQNEEGISRASMENKDNNDNENAGKESNEKQSDSFKTDAIGTKSMANDSEFSLEKTSFKVSDKKIADEDLIKQISEHMNKMRLKSGTQTVRMKLKPEALGEVNLKISLEKGSLSTELLAENNEVKEILEKHLSVLKNHLEQQGYEVKEFKVVSQEETQNANYLDQENENNKQEREQKRQSKEEHDEKDNSDFGDLFSKMNTIA